MKKNILYAVLLVLVAVMVILVTVKQVKQVKQESRADIFGPDFNVVRRQYGVPVIENGWEIGEFGRHCATHFGPCCATHFGDMVPVS